MSREPSPTLPDFDLPHSETAHLAGVLELLTGHIEGLRHGLSTRLVAEGRNLAHELRTLPPQAPTCAQERAVLERVLDFQARARDLLRGSR